MPFRGIQLTTHALEPLESVAPPPVPRVCRRSPPPPFPSGDRPFGGWAVYIDGLNLALEEGTGVATYARNLTGALHELGCEVGVLYGGAAGGGDDLASEVSFFDPLHEQRRGPLRLVRSAAAVVRALGGSTAREIRLSGAVVTDDFKSRLASADRLFNVGRLFHLANSYFDVFGRFLEVRVPDPPAVMHWTYPVPITVKGAANIYTLHDLVPLRLPHTTLDRKRRYLKLVRKIAAEADHLVTVSECSRQDIIDLLHVPPWRITNTYQSVDIPEAVRHRPEVEVRAEVEGVFGLPYRGYFLFVGAIEPKKNVGRLIQAYLASGVEAPLVLVGRKAWKYRQELKFLGLGRGRSDRVIQLDYCPAHLLPSLIRGAKAVTFPSLYEGFGLPVLEALTLSAPVLTSRTSSLPEVTGTAALLVDPYSVGAIRQAIVRLDQDAELRGDLAARGPEQAAQFSPSAYRDRLTALYAQFRPATTSAGPSEAADRP